MKCNICGGIQFGEINGRTNARCLSCGSYERTRLLFIYLEKLNIQPDWKVLHLAPERGLFNILSALVLPGNYITADLNPARYLFDSNCRKLNLCDLDSELSGQYDLIIHSHVLEHTPCPVAYTLYHLHRMLKKDGHHVCIIPFSKGAWDECFDQGLSHEERKKRFGQWDHVRLFGRDDVFLNLGKLLNLPADFDATRLASPDTLSLANIPKSHWYGFHGGTVLVLSKNDMKLLSAII
jgi:hypothetical protein